MKLIDIANIACGGHAGDKESVDYYMALAKANKVKISAHLSYPDKENFGRNILGIGIKELLKSLTVQYSLMPEIKTLKFHGALYNEANTNMPLASFLVRWAKDFGITEVLTPYNSCIAKACEMEDIQVLNEVFLDRKYIFEDAILRLSPRSNSDALITEIKEVTTQYKNFLKGRVQVKGNTYSVKADTGCIHSDSPNALEMAKTLCSL